MEVGNEPGDKEINVQDEVCTNEEYHLATIQNEEKSICSVEIFLKKYSIYGIEPFRAKVEEYFKNRKE